MPAWSGLFKSLSKLLKGGGASASTAKVAGEAVQAGAATLITWGNAFKVAIAGGFTWLFLNGGASGVVSSTLGISQSAAQILIIFGFIVLMVIITRFIVNYVRSKLDLRREYFETPILMNRRQRSREDDGPDYWEGYRWGRRRFSGSRCWQAS